MATTDGALDTTQSENMEIAKYLENVLTVEELKLIPNELACKIETHYNEKLEKLFTSNAISEAGRQKASEKAEKFEEEFNSLSSKYEECKNKSEAFEETIGDLNSQLFETKEELSKTADALRKAESDLEFIKNDRCSAVDERDSLSSMLERRERELERLKSDIAALTSHLESSVNAKCEALTKLNEFQSKEIALNFREQRIEREKLMLKDEIKRLDNELSRRNEELQTTRCTLSQRILHLDSQIQEKNEEIKSCRDSINNLNEVNKTLRSNNDMLIQKFLDQQELGENMSRSYRTEIEGKTKLADLYKSMQDDAEAKSEELVDGVKELQKLLSESVDEYGVLETKYKQLEADHEEMLERKNSTIASMKKELINANDLLQGAQDSAVSQILEKIHPMGVAAGRFLHANMTMTQLYTQLTDVADDLAQEKEENKRVTEALAIVSSDLREKAPMIDELQNRYEEAIEVNGTINRQLEAIVAENNSLTDDYNQILKRSDHLEKDNYKVRKELKDLGKQVSYLLREIEMFKGGSIPNGDKDSDIQPESLNSSELISRHLVTFGDIQELQNKNQKLLRTVRELTEKQEEKEKQESELNVTEIQKKAETLEAKMNEMVKERNETMKMVEKLVEQRDMYKKQCAAKKSDILEEVNNSRNKSSCDETLNKTIEEETLRKQLNETKSLLDKKIEQHKTYKEDSIEKQKLLMKQIEDMRKELSETTMAYSKVAVRLECLNEKQITLQLNINTYKNQINSLERANKSYTVTNGKNEQAMMHMRQEIANITNNQSRSEGQIQNLLKEVQHLRTVETKLTTERDTLIKEKQEQGSMLYNLEMIKYSLERAEGDSRTRLESRLDDANREIIVMRRTLQEEQTRFRELTSLLEKQKNEAVTKMEEEKNQADKLRDELDLLRDKMKNKAINTEDFIKEIPLESDDNNVDFVKRVKELETILNSKQSEHKYLQQQLELTQERVQQYRDLGEEVERQLQTLNSQYEELKASSELRINTLEVSETELKERCSDLEAELSIETDGQHVSHSELKNKLAKSIERIEALEHELKCKCAELIKTQGEFINLSVSREQAEEKYAHEMVLHSNDMQELSQCKEKLIALEQSFAELESSKLEAINSLSESKETWEEQLKTSNAENKELNSRFANLTEQNSMLLDQIQALSTKLSLATVSKQTDNLNDSANLSMGETSFNRSVNEDEVKSSEKLVQIIKFLRKERDIIVCKFDILQAENIKYRSQLDITNKKLDEAKLSLAVEQQKAEENSMASTKHSEILRKVEQFNAISDSNRILREERENLNSKVNSLSEVISKMEDALAPLQESNQELTRKLDSVQSENSSLKTELGRWRTRVSSLVESVNKTSSEDWRKLQNERETLTKVLTSEREIIKKLNEEAVSIKTEKIKLEEQISILNKQHIAQTDLYKKQTDEFATLKKDYNRVTHELEHVKTNLNEKANDITKLNENNNEKETTINDLRNKEAQIRKIAKKYKAQFEELTKSVEESKLKKEDEASASTETQEEIKKEYETKMVDLEKSWVERVSELEIKITAALEESRVLKVENDERSVASNEKEEKAKQLLKQAKMKIVNLTENNEKLVKELNEIKEGLQTAEQNKEENNTRFELLSSQYESRLGRNEKEKNEALQEKQQEIHRLNKEIENLNQRISQLQRQVGGPEAVSATCAPTPTPTANIKPMAAHSASPHPQQATRRGETPFASIRPMASTATRTAAVLPSPSSSGHSTEYMPASSSARPRPPAADSPPHPPQALVLPRVEEGPGSQPTPPSHSSQAAPPRPSLKRKPQHSHKTSQQLKRSKVQQGQVTESHCETEYQVPTSSQRDHDDDGVILVDSEEDGEAEIDYETTYQDGDDEDANNEELEEEEEEMDDDEEDEEGEAMGEEDDDEAEDPEAMDEEEEVEAEGVGEEDEAEEEEEGREEEEEDDKEEEQEQELPAQSECEVGDSSEAAVSPAPQAAGPPSTSQQTDAQQAQQTHAVSSGTLE